MSPQTPYLVCLEYWEPDGTTNVGRGAPDDRLGLEVNVESHDEAEEKGIRMLVTMVDVRCIACQDVFEMGRLRQDRCETA